MALRIIDEGRNNVVAVSEAFARTAVGTITLRGCDNHVSIGPGCRMESGMFDLGDGCRVDIEQDCSLGALEIVARSRCSVRIGRQTGFTWSSRLQLNEPSRVEIGEGCLFAVGTAIYTSDSHSILDAGSGLRLNPAADVRLAAKVWVGEGARILKGCTIGTQSVIGLGSVVTGDVEARCVVAGVPARIVRRGVTWTHALL